MSGGGCCRPTTEGRAGRPSHTVADDVSVTDGVGVVSATSLVGRPPVVSVGPVSRTTSTSTPTPSPVPWVAD